MVTEPYNDFAQGSCGVLGCLISQDPYKKRLGTVAMVLRRPRLLELGG